MGQVLIRNIDQHVLERLKGRAAAQNKSLEQSLRDLLTEVTRPHPAELLADAERIRAMAPSSADGEQFPSAEALIREARDAR